VLPVAKRKSASQGLHRLCQGLPGLLAALFLHLGGYALKEMLQKTVRYDGTALPATPGAGFTNFTKFLIRILLSFYHVAQAPRRTLVGLYQHIPTNSVGESGPRVSSASASSSPVLNNMFPVRCDTQRFPIVSIIVVDCNLEQETSQISDCVH
jgi:hypothetical protein